MSTQQPSVIREPAAMIVRREAELQSGAVACTVVGTQARLGPLWAALVNGTASHVLTELVAEART